MTLRSGELSTPGYLEALNQNTIGLFGDDSGEATDSGGDAPAEDPGLDAHYPTADEQQAQAEAAGTVDSQWASDADLLQSIGFGDGSSAFTGASDPNWTATVRAFQSDQNGKAGPVDGIMGPMTRAAAQAELARQEGSGGDSPAPSPGSSPLPATPASASTTTSPNRHLLLWGAAGLAAVLVVGLALTGGKKK